MPGISLVKSAAITTSLISSIQNYNDELIKSLPHLSSKTLFRNNQTLIHLVSHISYQFLYNQIGDWQIYYEGPENLDLAIVEKSLNIFIREILPKDEMLSWRAQAFTYLKSGFLFVAHHQLSGMVVFANDDLARLPVYVFHNNDMLIISREYSLIRALTQSLVPDRLLLALYLIFGYAPGHGSPYREIDTLPCSSIGLFKQGTNNLFIISDTSRRMPQDIYKGSQKTLLLDLKSSFVKATELCLRGKRPLLALSGGYDSRAVAAALLTNRIDFESITYLDSDKTACLDFTTARDLANHLDILHSMLILPLEDASHYKSLFTIKNGLNFMGMAFFILFLEEIRKQFGDSFVFLTGDGGDKVIPPLLPIRTELDINSTLRYIYEKNSIFDKMEVARILDLKPDTLDGYLLDLVINYPVQNWNDKYRYFMLAERGGRWLFEGEDRNRYYCISETPFYNLDFYHLTLSIPVSWKANNSLYRKFLHNLYPPVCEIPFAGQRMKPDSVSYELIQLGIDFLRQSQLIRKLRKSRMSNASQYASKHFLQQRLNVLIHNDTVMSLMPNYPRTGDWINGEQMSKVQLSNLYTVLTMISNTYC